ncbi:MAG: hypothetical protein WD355_09355 [Balneolaceae bacterium]
MNAQTSRHNTKIELKPLLFKVGFLLWILCTAIGCDETFQPLKENDRFHFSVFGYLDATADTQIVRLIPLRKSILELPPIDDVTVTLTHLESGEQTVMQDSLYRFYYDEAQTYNYLTNMEILPEQRYRLDAKHADGRSSHTTVTIPPEFPEPWFSNPTVLRVEGVERLAEVRVIYHLQYLHPHGWGEPFTITIPHLERTNQFTPTSHRVFLNPTLDQEAIRGANCDVLDQSLLNIYIRNREIFVASAGPEWVDFLALDEVVETFPDQISNIENGTGFFAGIVSKIIPYNQNLTTLIECEIDDDEEEDE